MPELPDVEGHRRFVAERAAGRTVERVEAPDPDLVRNTTPQGLGRALNGRTFREPSRHGKWLLAHTDGPTLVLHFGMTGYLHWGEAGDDRHEHDRVVVVTDGGELRFNCMRKFGGVWLARDDPAEVTGPLGPDALEVDRDAFGELLAGRRGGVKSALMDQELLAGLGNLLADEILWRARTHPRTPVGDLDAGDVDDLHDAMREVLTGALPHERVPPEEGWLTGVRDEDAPSCPRCGAPLEHGTVASRSTWWCPACQPPPSV